MLKWLKGLFSKRKPDYMDVKAGDTFTIEGVHRLPDGSLRFGNKHKKHRQDKMPVFVVEDKRG